MNLSQMNRLNTKKNTTIDWDVDVAGGAAAIEAVTVDGADTNTDNVVPAQLRIGNYRLKHQFKISRVAIAEAASRAPEELQNLFNAHVDRGITHICRQMNGLLYTGNALAASGEVVGLTKVAEDAYAYAGVNPATYPAWRVVGLGNAGVARALTKDLFYDLEEQVTISETMYDMIVCSPSVAKTYNKLFDTLNAGVAQSMANDGQFRNVDLGHGGRYYNGRPLIEDPQCPTGMIYFINSADVTLHTFRFDQTPELSQQEKVVVNRAYGLNLHISELPSNNSAVRKFEMYILPQLQVFNRKSVQIIRDLA